MSTLPVKHLDALITCDDQNQILGQTDLLCRDGLRSDVMRRPCLPLSATQGPLGCGDCLPRV